MANGLLNNLVAYWKLEEGATGPYLDETSNNNDLTENGSIVDIPTAIIGSGIHNNDTGETNYVSISHASQTDLEGNDGDLTISAWVKNTDVITSTFPPIANKENGSSAADTTYRMFIDGESGDNKCGFVTSDGTSSENLSATAVITDQTWHHVVFTWNETTKEKTVWVDNVEEATATASHGTPLNNPGGPFTLGRLNNAPTAGAKIQHDEVGVWRAVLTDTQIGQLYNSGSGLAYDSFDDGTATSNALFLLGGL